MAEDDDQLKDLRAALRRSRQTIQDSRSLIERIDHLLESTGTQRGGADEQ